jgi:hypothetical protein
MSRKSVEWGASLLALAVLAAILWSGYLPNSVETSALYLLAASGVDLYCLLVSLSVRAQLRKSDSVQVLGLLQTRAQVLFLVAWQLAIVGVLHILQDNFAVTSSILVMCGLLLAMCIFLSDRLIAIADRPNQDGGSKPLRARGRPRSRRLFFWVWIVYPWSTLAGASVMMFIGKGRYPSLFHPPQVCLLLEVVFSAGVAALVFQRYRELAFSGRLAAACFLPAVVILGFAGVFEMFSSSSSDTFWTSSLIVTCVSLSAYWLLRGNGMFFQEVGRRTSN